MVFKHLVKYNGVYYPAGLMCPWEINPLITKKEIG